MKYCTLFLFFTLLLSCAKKRPTIELTVDIPEIQSGSIIIKDDDDSVVFGDNIKNGKFTLIKPFDKPGYYDVNIYNNTKTDSTKSFEMYLESGKYNIEATQGKLFKYPKIISSSKIQNQLTAFYMLLDSINDIAEKNATRLNEEIKTESDKLTRIAFNSLLNKLSAINNQLIANNVTAFEEFVKRYPDNDIGMHLMDNLHYGANPIAFYEIYKALPTSQRNSDRGKYIGHELSLLVNLLPGSRAPSILGKTADGKSFDYNSIDKKIILLDFWRSTSELSRTNHQKFAELLMRSKYKNKLNIISVSFDSNRSVWLRAIGNDQMTWTQVSDLKGEDSPNIENWMVHQFPSYFLVDDHWRIIKNDLLPDNIDDVIRDYLDNHH
jgi:hypothetical protein